MAGDLLKQSSTAQPLVFLMVLTSDHISPATGLTPTVTLSKNGGAFASPSGTVTEIANGWYKVAGNATDTGTLGPLILHATGTAADPVDERYSVVAFDPQVATNLGLSALPTAAVSGVGGLLTAPTTANTGLADVTRWNGTAVTTPDTAGSPKVTVTSGTGTGQISLSSGLVTLAGVTHTGATIPTVTTVGTLTTYTGNTPQTGDAYAIVNSGTFGNAKLVRSTTPANTLDVSATGEAGVDWANVGSPTTTVALSGTTVGTTTTLTNPPRTSAGFLGSDLIKYGTATTTGTHVGVAIPKAGSPDLAASGDWTPATGDVKVSKDSGAEANIATLPSFVNGTWEFQFSSGETTCKELRVKVVDSATKAVEDVEFALRTFGNASARYPVDIST